MWRKDEKLNYIGIVMFIIVASSIVSIFYFERGRKENE